ncbi:hypothetical protein BUE93_09250 [Chromobacterium amazonense]|uniref:Type 4b pilus protein PilO2 n=1 Tax=Chromobacterium amazonense TaxID=1382803 RepID=A0A2S9X5E9_9NEIS|nr:type 4b pilus protein PilO2 [Chromobacterium amazonense]PRP70950.1 hypothetical protein BUE93_09250 [Chromobacterium amazonense]
MEWGYQNTLGDDQSSQVGVVKMGRRSYAVSLLWMQLETDGPELKVQAGIAAERIDLGLVLLRAGRGHFPDQFALGDYGLSHKSGMPSLAASLAERVNESIFAVWPLQGGVWWLVGINQDGTILFDRASTREEEIREYFEQGLAEGDWQKIICPDDWRIEGSVSNEQVDFELGKTKLRLKAVKTEWGPILTLAGSIACMAVIGGVAYNWWEKQEAEKQEVKLPAQVKKKVLLTKPWVGKVSGVDSIRACSNFLVRFSSEASGIPGWEPKLGICDGKKASFQLNRTGGNLHWLEQFAAELKGLPSVLRTGDKSANLSWIFEELTIESDEKSVADLDALQQALQAEFDDLGLPVKWNRQNVEWPSLQLQVELEHPPTILLPLLAPIPAWSVREIRYDLESQTWMLDADIFGTVKQ